ncbi:hypothetical protein D3C87_1989920 [compost metagenome]
MILVGVTGQELLIMFYKNTKLKIHAVKQPGWQIMMFILKSIKQMEDILLIIPMIS